MADPSPAYLGHCILWQGLEGAAPLPIPSMYEGPLKTLGAPALETTAFRGQTSRSSQGEMGWC